MPAGKGAPTPKQLQRMYELTQRLESQELAVIYDMEAFDGPAAQEQRTLAQQHSGGENRNGIVTLKIGEPLPSMKKLTEAVEEHWKAMLHVAISDAAAQEPLPYLKRPSWRSRSSRRGAAIMRGCGIPPTGRSKLFSIT